MSHIWIFAPKIPITYSRLSFGNFEINLARFARNLVKWDFLSDFQTLCKKDEIEFATYASTSKDVNM